jgi:nucleoid DNA-binding protein
MDAAIAALVDAIASVSRHQWFVLPGVGWLAAVPRDGYAIVDFAGARELYATLFGEPVSVESLEGERDRYALAIAVPGVEMIASAILGKLRAREAADISNLGVFDIVEKPARMARNPQTLEESVMPARSIVVFRAAESLRTRLKYPRNYRED